MPTTTTALLISLRNRPGFCVRLQLALCLPINRYATVFMWFYVNTSLLLNTYRLPLRFHIIRQVLNVEASSV